MTASTTLFLPFRKGLISLSDPGGRTENMHGLNSRSAEWFRLPEHAPAASGILVLPPGAATACEVDEARRPGRVT